jgi:hypothetical protein
LLVKEPGEQAQRRRQAILLLSLLLLLMMQWIAVGASQRIQAGTPRTVDIAQVIAPVLVALGLLRGFFGSPMWIAREAKLAANDELAVDNRRRALGFGMICAAFTALVACLLTPFVPLDSIVIAHAMLSALLAPAICRFVWLER